MWILKQASCQSHGC